MQFLDVTDVNSYAIAFDQAFCLPHHILGRAIGTIEG